MHEIEAALVGARIQRIDGPLPGVIALTVHRADRHGCLLLAADAHGAEWGWSGDRPRGAPASAFVQLLRKHLVDEKIDEVRIEESAIEIAAGARLRLDAQPPNLTLLVGASSYPLWRAPSSARSRPFAGDLEALDRAGASIVADRAGARAAAIVKAIARRRASLARRVEAIDADLARARAAPGLRDLGSLLLASLGQIPAGAKEAIVTDWTVDPPVPRTIAIDPARGPKGEAEHLFKRARKLERGAAIAIERRTATEREISELTALADRASEANADLDAIEREAARLGARPQRVGSRAVAEARRPFRTFRGAHDRAIWVGRSAADNDTLTLKIARPHHHWLHARGGAGAHVIVPLDRGEDCPSELLIDAAHLAAHFCALRGESPVEIAHCARRYVRKPRGAPPGLVSVSHAKTLVLRVDPGRVDQLLAREDHA